MTDLRKNDSDQHRYGGGVFIALGAVAGAIGGGMYNGQPFPGFVIGTATGIIIATIIWLRTRHGE